MTVQPAIRLIGGSFVAVSALLGIYVHPGFLWFTLFVGLNLVQSAFSQRRKLLRHSLGRWLEAQGYEGDFDLQRRAEEVPVAEEAPVADAPTADVVEEAPVAEEAPAAEAAESTEA